MAQIWLGEKEATQEKDESVEAEKGGFPKYNYKRSRTYLIIANALSDSEEDILANVNVPALGSTTTLGMPVKSRKATYIARITRHPVTSVPTALWEVEVSGDSELTFVLTGNPVVEDRDLLVRWTIEEEELAFTHDAVHGYPVVNANGEPCHETIKVAYPVLELTRLEPYPMDPFVMGFYFNSLNKESFWGFPPKTGKMTLEAVEEIDEEEAIIYSKVTYKIAFKVGVWFDDDPWLARPLHEGFLVRHQPGVKPVVNKTEGNPVKINLAEDGTALPDGDDPFYLSFNKYIPKSWFGLGMHQPDDYPFGPPEEEP